MTQACNEQTCFLSSGEKDFSVGPYCEFDNIWINCVALIQFHTYVGLFMINGKKTLSLYFLESMRIHAENCQIVILLTVLYTFKVEKFIPCSCLFVFFHCLCHIKWILIILLSGVFCFSRVLFSAVGRGVSASMIDLFSTKQVRGKG